MSPLSDYDEALRKVLAGVKRLDETEAVGLAEAAGRPVAVAGVEGPKLEKFAHHGELGMCVLRDHCRLGIGRAILDYLVAWAQQAGLRKLCLRVYDFNEPAYRLYCGAGFTEEGRLKADVLRADGTYGDTIYMAKHFV